MASSAGFSSLEHLVLSSAKRVAKAIRRPFPRQFILRVAERVVQSIADKKSAERIIQKLAERDDVDLLDVAARKKGIGPRPAEQVLQTFADRSKVNLLDFSYRKIGINKWETAELSGESYLIEKVLPRLITSTAPTFLDVGANEGSYSTALRRQFPAARIIAFEPQPQIFERCARVLGPCRVDARNVALGAEEGTATIYDYAGQAGTA